MGRLLLAITLLLAGCGSLSLEVAPAPAPTTEYPLRGPLPVLVALVSYADTPCPFDEPQALALSQALDAFITRNSNGRCWVVPRVAPVALPGAGADYAGDYAHERSDGPLQVATRAATAADPEPYTVYLCPLEPALWVGVGRADHRQGWAWLSPLWWSGDLRDLPLAHEFGHALGLPHRPGGVMDPAYGGAADWGGWYDDAALEALGWRL